MDTTHAERTIHDACKSLGFDLAARTALETYGDEVLGFLCARLKNPADAREVFSMFAEDMWTGLPNFGFRCSVRTWLYTLARNAATRYGSAAHRGRARNVPLSDVEGVEALVDRLRSRTELHLRTEVKDRFRQLREQLDDEDQTLLILRVDRGLSFRELAVAVRGDAELDDDAITREAARLRKAFERVKAELRVLAEREGLLRQGG